MRRRILQYIGENRALAEWNSQRMSMDIDLYIRAMAEYEGPDGWVQASRAGTWMTKAGLLEFYAGYRALLRRYEHDEESAPPGARPVAIRFLAIPEEGHSGEEPPGAGAVGGAG